MVTFGDESGGDKDFFASTASELGAQVRIRYYTMSNFHVMYNQSYKIPSFYQKEGGGCGRFWYLSLLEISSLYKSFSGISFCTVRD